jgi:D-aminoacyl-tRNA deacylase
MIQKFLIVGSKSDPASRNIIMNLMDIGKFDFYIIEGEMLKTENLDPEKIKQFDMIIFTSKHKSEKHEKTLSIHAPGNFREIWGGGKEKMLGPASALFEKHLFEALVKEKEDSDLTRYSVTMEATHHGPLIERPSVFIEIGGTEDEWRDKGASFVAAKAIRNALKTWKENPYREIAVGIGGPHYCPGFNKIQLKSNVAISHIIPKYVSPITEEMILEAINKTVEEVDFVLIDWKGVGKAEERDKIIEILEKNYIHWKKISDINKS